MKTVGTLEARTHLSRLLEQVERGQEITITRRGRAVARLVPLGAVSREGLAGTVARLKSFRRGRRLGDLSANALIEEGAGDGHRRGRHELPRRKCVTSVHSGAYQRPSASLED
jgi:prevent-host-death family protein